VRVLASAANAAAAFDLRCEVREKLIAFLRAEYPLALPRVRAEVTREGAGALREAANRDGGELTPTAAPSRAAARG
jgi:hypothetical protein